MVYVARFKLKSKGLTCWLTSFMFIMLLCTKLCSFYAGGSLPSQKSRPVANRVVYCPQQLSEPWLIWSRATWSLFSPTTLSRAQLCGTHNWFPGITDLEVLPCINKPIETEAVRQWMQSIVVLWVHTEWCFNGLLVKGGSHWNTRRSNNNGFSFTPITQIFKA